MTTSEFATTLLNNAEKQLKVCFADLTDEQYRSTPVEGMMGAKDLILHLIDVYIAVQDMAKGVDHLWGSHHSPDTSLNEDLARLWKERATAVEIALAHLEDKPAYAMDYLIEHDFYHIGQICWMRKKLQPDWTTYEIYR